MKYSLLLLVLNYVFLSKNIVLKFPISLIDDEYRAYATPEHKKLSAALKDNLDHYFRRIFPVDYKRSNFGFRTHFELEAPTITEQSVNVTLKKYWCKPLDKRKRDAYKIQEKIRENCRLDQGSYSVFVEVVDDDDSLKCDKGTYIKHFDNNQKRLCCLPRNGR
jgi:hypothetical protein